MSVKKQDFYGKEVTDAIKTACESFNVAQEELDIEVVETGSTGIFGLIRKKARIRVSLKERRAKDSMAKAIQDVAAPEPVAEEPLQPEISESPAVHKERTPEPEKEVTAPVVKKQPQRVAEPVESDDDDDEEDSTAVESEGDTSPESLEIIRTEVTRLVELMGYPSNIDVTAEGLSVACRVTGDFEEQLAGPEGKTLDSIQYLIRKMVTRKCSERLRVTINVGNFRECRLEELKERAVELSAKVKETGKTQVLPALNPSERREIHMVLQEDKEVRSRSVGDGLFKKILIYKPGKGNRGSRRKSGPRNRRGKNTKNDSGTTEE